MPNVKKLGRVPYVRDDGREVERLMIKCPCGSTLVCGTSTNQCECGRDYNMSGQELAPREQWGEETGEHPLDIANHNGLDEVDY